MKKVLLLIMLIMLMLPVQLQAYTLINMGECKITYYCACEECSGPWGNITATGTRCSEGRTVAVDPDVIAYGTKLLINGHVFTAEDCGGSVKGDHIDIYLEDHDRVDMFGVDYTNVWIIKGDDYGE